MTTPSRPRSWFPPLAASLLLACSGGDGPDAPDPAALRDEPVRVSTRGIAADDPDVAVDVRGAPWIVYVEFIDRETRVVLRAVTAAGRGEPIRLSPDGTDVSSPRIAWNGAGFTVVWTRYDAGRCGLVAVELDPRGRPLAPPRPVAAEGEELDPVLAGGDGGVALVSVAKRAGRRVVHLRRRTGAGFGVPVTVSDPGENAYSPDAAADGAGTWVAWDTAADGSFDVLLARVEGDRVAERVAVAASPLFEAHASLAVAPDGRVLVAYDQGDEEWGRGRARFSMEAVLHLRRAAALRAVEGRTVLQPARTLGSFLPAPFKMVHEYPRVAVDGAGRPVVTLRTIPTRNPLEKDERSVWANLVLAPDRRGELKLSAGRNDVRPRLARTAAGDVLAAWPSDLRAIHRAPDEPWFVPPVPDGTQAVFLGALAAGDAERGTGGDAFDLGPWRPVEPDRIAAPLEPLADLAARPPWWPDDGAAPDDGTPRVGHPARAYAPWSCEHRGGTVNAYFGDLHRHTDISRCWMNKDGSLEDVLRYALDVARLDFLAVTNHPAHMTSWDRRRAEQAVDEHHLEGSLVTFFGYEHVEPRGHKNVVFPSRADAKMVSFAASERRPGRDDAHTEDPGEFLAALEETGALAIPHTPAGQGPNDLYGTDWSYHAPGVQRLVEIFQGYRGSYEGADEPRAFPVPNHDAGFVRDALARGLELGFVASSDHQATEVGYAGVVAAEKTRDAIFRALRDRHTFAATARIVLFAGTPDGAMGDVVERQDVLPLTVKARGTAPIRVVELIADGDVVETLRPGGGTDLDRKVDVRLPAGASYLYVRLTQVDGELAWSSPFFFR